MGHRDRSAGLVALIVLVVAAAAACSDGADSSGDPAAEGVEESSTTSTTAAPCRDDLLEDDERVSFDGADPAAVAAGVAGTTHRCSDVAVVAPSDDAWAALVAAPLALEGGAPLLLVDPLTPETALDALETLEVAEVISVGVDLIDRIDAGTDVTALSAPDAGAPSGEPAEARLPADVELALAVVEHVEARRVVLVPSGDVAARAALPEHLDADAVVPLPDQPGFVADIAARLGADVRAEVLASDPAYAAAVVARFGDVGVEAAALAPPDAPVDTNTRTAWLVDPDDHAALAVAGVAAAHRDESLLAIDASDLRSGRARTAALRAASPERVVLVGDVTEHADWQLDVVLEGPELPAGGFRLLEDTRMVAIYGHPGATSLGALGEQDLESTVGRVTAMAEPYGADGRAVVPAFEIIATVASSAPGPYGDYSLRESVEALRPWVDRAAAEGFYVVLDLQPGHTDFLEQARHYEELLREPHVGLALDPEWRLAPDERHLDQIGSVPVEEVQRVADWLAELTRENGLPQKLLLLHQFRHSMLPDRDALVAPPELAVVVHMDGQGPLSTKYGTYDAITAGVEDRWLWGWKNFYDEDAPTARPDEVLALDPRPVFVSYQ